MDAMKKRVLLFLAVVGLVAAGAAYRYGFGVSEATAPPPQAVAVVERGTVRLGVAATGRVVANLDVEIKCKASGQVVALPFDVSDTVRKGELLVELDPDDEQRLMRQSEAALTAAEARLAQARQNQVVAERTLATEEKRAQVVLESARVNAEDAGARAERLKHLLANTLASQEQTDAAVTAAAQAATQYAEARLRVEELATERLALELRRQDVRLAETDVESQHLALALAKQRLDDTKVLAPIDGVVTTRAVQNGQIISSGISNVGGGTTVLTLSDLSRLFILAAVDESDIGRVAAEQPVIITADAYPTEQFEGRVVRIATRGENVSNVVTFEVKIEVLGERKARLLPEMTANVEIVAAEKADVLLVPVQAVQRDGRGALVVLADGDGTGEERRVDLGISDGVVQEVVAGLREGDRVVLPREAPSRWRGTAGGDQARRQRAMRMMIGGPRR